MERVLGEGLILQGWPRRVADGIYKPRSIHDYKMVFYSNGMIYSLHKNKHPEWNCEPKGPLLPEREVDHA